MLKVKDLVKILEELPDEAEVIIDDGDYYDIYAEVKWFKVNDKLPYLVILKE